MNWLQAAARDNLDASGRLLAWRSARAAANRLWYALYHTCWYAMDHANIAISSVQKPKFGQPAKNNTRWRHETFNGAVMFKAPLVVGLGWPQHQVHRLLTQVRQARVDADYTGVAIDDGKLKAYYAEAEKFIHGILI